MNDLIMGLIALILIPILFAFIMDRLTFNIKKAPSCYQPKIFFKGDNNDG
jgi:hypothetical protein